ncbi:hypothetical protein PCO85_02710 [Prodigiosinella aquatilis]|nr:hypothetical protein [Prodigiosinella sp. LS101]WJV54401.1 hypothetical protein PCO85_02710 [Prodigiosinella sp. LS101]WJV58762.1 hypothetical protein PCO84_02720 [Pectobacteriaceae bacterium C111]
MSKYNLVIKRTQLVCPGTQTEGKPVNQAYPAAFTPIWAIPVA